jgi:hypothetical protein
MSPDMYPSVLTALRADQQRQSRAHAELTASIAAYLADDSREDVSKHHITMAEEIIAMVNEAERLANTRAA